MAKIKIMHLLNGLADASITRIVENIVRLSDSADYAWSIGSFRGNGQMAPTLESLGVKIIDYSGSSRKEEIINDIFSQRPQIIHTHTPRTTITAWEVLRRFPKVDRPHHIATKHLLTRPSDRKWGLVYSLIDYFSLYLPDRLVPVSYTMGDEIGSLPAIKKNRIVPIPNGIPCENYTHLPDGKASRTELDIPDEALVLGFAGRMDPVKRIDLLLSAYKQVSSQFPQLWLLLVGEGKMKQAWQQHAEKLGIAGKVIWAGFRQDMPRMMSAMDVYVQATGNEGLSLSILEAMAAGKPVIASQVGAANELLIHRQTGWLIPPGSIGHLVEAIQAAIQQPDLFFEIAKAARQKVLNSYSVNAMVTGYQQLYHSVERGE